MECDIIYVLRNNMLEQIEVAGVPPFILHQVEQVKCVQFEKRYKKGNKKSSNYLILYFLFCLETKGFTDTVNKPVYLFEFHSNIALYSVYY